MKREIWKHKYIKKLINLGLDEDLAEDCFFNGEDSYDFDDSPEDAAIDEAYYWCCD